MGQTTKAPHHQLDLAPVQALWGSAKDTQPLDGLVATFHTNERPLQGLVGLLDWHFHGAISDFLRAGAVKGEVGECAYLPLVMPQNPGGRVYHLILLGAGSAPTPGKRQALDSTSCALLKKNILSLKIPRIGVSRADFGNPSPETLAGQFKEVPLWIVN